MPLYTPKLTRNDFVEGKNILASEHLQFIEGGATLDADAFGKGLHEAGKLIARNTNSGKFEPVGDVTGDDGGEDGEPTTGLEGFDNFSILNVDYDCDGENDVIAGEVIVRGSVYEEKLADEVSDDFKEVTPMIRYVNHL